MDVRPDTQYAIRNTHRLIAGAVVVTVALWCGQATLAQAQDDLINLYQAERAEAQMQRMREDPRALSPRPAERVTPSADTIRRWLRRRNGWTPPEEPEPLRIERWRAVRRLERNWFRSEHGQGGWAFSGASRLRPLDTLFTPELRARLEERFGPPTRTIGDFSPDEFEQADAPAQFEYWLVANDSIPLKVMDVNGPFERGLVVASARRYGHRLGDLRDALEAELSGARVEPKRFVDYYYLAANDTWFLAGYDGEQYFLKVVDPPNLHLGRPWLDEYENTKSRK
jgi:hypothetical protein